MSESKTLGDKCIEQFPGRIPIIVVYDTNIIFLNNTTKTAQSRQSKLLVQEDTTIGYLCMIIGRNAKINKIENIRIIINNNIMDENNIISKLYTKYKNQTDGCLHINVKY